MDSLILYYLLLLAAIFVHEVGHVFGALFVGYQITRFKVGPIEYNKTGSVSNVRLSLAIFSGIVDVARPQGPVHIRKELIFFSAGVAANGIFAVLLIISYYLWPDNEFKGFLIIGAIASGLMAAMNLIPWSNKRAGFATDGVFIIIFFINWLAGLKKPNKSRHS